MRSFLCAMTGLLLAGVLSVNATAATAAGQSPEQFVEQTAAQVLEILRGTASKQEKLVRLEALLDTKSDIDTVTKLVLASNYRTFSEQQRGEFQKLFKQYLSATYGGQIDKYSNERVEVTGGRPEAHGDYTVQTRLKRTNGQPDILVDYRLRQKNGQWLLIDVIGEGVSLIANLRSQFQEILSQGGPERLLKVLREKSAA
ncbi:MAG TPA: ABC transporter substrate-binding protein [Candidatus Limnocylindrales bacterium]|nr:ABC transporter substrate-binding protein [Candidatus Limnocylindrales bacterium]